jgi:hypothetical protein
MAETKDKTKSDDQWTKIGTQQPEKHPGPFAQDRSRTPPSKEQRERDYDEPHKTARSADDDEMDDVMRRTPL